MILLGTSQRNVVVSTVGLPRHSIVVGPAAIGPYDALPRSAARQRLDAAVTSMAFSDDDRESHEVGRAVLPGEHREVLFVRALQRAAVVMAHIGGGEVERMR